MDVSFFRAFSVLVTLLIAHLLFVYFKSDYPGRLVYAPVLLYLHFRMQGRSKSQKYWLLWGALIVFFFLFYLSSLFFSNEKNSLWTIYINVYNVVVIVTYLIMSLYVLSKKKNWLNPVDWDKSRALTLLCITLFMISILLSFGFFYPENSPYDPSGRMFHYTILALMCFGAILMLQYLLSSVSKKKVVFSSHASPATDILSEKQSFLPESTLKRYEIRLKELFEEKSLYLKYDMSMEVLALEMDIPKHHLSELFNHHLQVSFYRFVAEYRISHALKMIDEGREELTLEGLTYECGFNSKTTFNKYFRDITGYKLQEYKEKQTKETRTKS